MDLEFEDIEGGIKVSDSVIRPYPTDISDHDSCEWHFQARIYAWEMSANDSICCSFAYYSKEGEFIGLDSDEIWAGEFSLKNPYSISFALFPPENTHLVKCRIGVRKQEKGLWDYAWPAFVTLVFVLLISGIINVWL